MLLEPRSLHLLGLLGTQEKPSVDHSTFDLVGSIRRHDHMALHYLKFCIGKLLDVMVEQIACEGRDDHPQRIVSGS